jgi:capsule polysaccharide export protein KpsE/RkpR
MADSVKQHLQKFIIQYRTSKANEDVIHFEQMRDSAETEYNIAMERYSHFCDTHREVILQSYQSKQNKLETDLALKQNSLTAMETQLQNSKLKLQEKTPSFTTLKSATVPVKPAGPKRVIFVIGMLFLSTFATAIWLCKGHFII